MVLKIEAKHLLQFFNVVTLKGKIPEIILSFEASGAIVKCKQVNDTIITSTQLNKETFEEYQIIDKKLGIKNTKLLISILETFNGIVTLDITENLLTIYNKNKIANIVLAKPEFLIDTKISEIPNRLTEFDNGVQINSSIFKNSIKNTNALNSEYIYLEVKNKILNVTAGDKKFDKITEKIECEYKDIATGFQAEVLKSVVDILPEIINISILDNDLVLQFIIKDEILTSKIICAPVGTDESVSTPETRGEIDTNTDETTIESISNNENITTQ